MSYQEYSKEQLILRIEELERFQKELLREKEQETRLEYAWMGTLGQWYWDVKSNTVTFNPLKVTTLGYQTEELPKQVTYQFFTDKLHPEDYPSVMKAMTSHLRGQVNVYEAEYRIQAKDGSYRWYYDRGKITQYDQNGKPVFLAGIVFDITNRKQLQQELEDKNQILEKMTTLDGLTKINNHRSLIEQLKVSVSEASVSKQPFSIILFDIDDFKKINDRYGHLVGDDVLVGIADILSQSVRGNDVVGRYGGEEFMAILPKALEDKAIQIANRIRQAIEEHDFGQNIHVTISGGVATFNDEELYSLVDRADKRLYQAKQNGKNQIKP
jgi:diguanylate cyclase (GGDEF)-like protein/PAS domain S-box-containing protein